MNEILDCRGTQINIGDTIVYPGRRGSAMWLSEGIVRTPKIEGQLSLTVERTNNGRLVEIFETSRVAVVRQATA